MRFCEDYPCCGHEMGDCDGSLYGSDESIKARVHAGDPSVYEYGSPEWEDAMADLQYWEDEEEEDEEEEVEEADEEPASEDSRTASESG